MASPSLRGTLAATVLGSSLAFIDGSVVNVGLAAIERDLAGSGASGASIGWLINAYLLPLGALVLFGGVAGDRYGLKRVFLAGMAVFTAASVGCALAPGFAWLLGARALQGAGAAFLMPASLAILGAAFSGEARGRAVGTWAAAGAVTGALGPLAGGWLIDSVGWRAIFLVNVPVAAVAAWLAVRFVEARPGDRSKPLDVAGALLATLGLGLVVFGLAELAASPGAANGSATDWTAGPHDGGATAATATTLAALAGGVAALVAFVVVELRKGAAAMMPTALFGTRAFVGVTLFTLFLYAALGGLMVLLPYLLIRSAGYGAAAAGASLLPVAAGLGLGSRAAGRLAERIGARPLLVGGPLLIAAGFALLVRVPGGAVDYVRTLLPALVVLAVGLTLSVAPLTAAVMGSVDTAHVGSASGINNAVARIAGLIATALLGFVLTRPPQSAAFVAAFHAAAWIGAALAGLASAAALVLVDRLAKQPPAAA